MPDTPFRPKNPDGMIFCYSQIIEMLLSGEAPLENPTHFQDFADAKALEEALTKNISYKGAFGIEFPDEWSDITELPHRFRFALRFSVDKEDDFFVNLLISQLRTQQHYRQSGFLLLQTQISERYLQVKNGTQTVFRPQLKKLYEDVQWKLDDYFVIFLMCVFLCPFTMDVKDIVEEKELRLKEMLNIFDVSNYLQWLAWFQQCQSADNRAEESYEMFETYDMSCTPELTFAMDACSCLNLLDWVEVRYLLICGFIYMLLLIFAGYMTMLWYRIKHILCRCCKQNVTSNDADVAAAAERISEMSGEDRNKHALVLNRVSERYFRMSAVRGISFAVKPCSGVCFGLLGANGAGKTTTFKMIVGDIGMTTGNIHVSGCSLMIRPTAARKQIGYCPQHDTLFDFCTGRQTLRIFLLLRGTRRNLLKEATEKLASDFGFFAHLDNKVKDYSGGTKRKLNAAVASEGSSLICLDEPSSGVDPASRRHVWNVLTSLRDKGKAVVLSSHSMEEVEALCTQLAIMADGQIHCLGSQQRIKNKFAQCLVLKLHVETSPESMVHTLQKTKNQMEADYPTSSLEEEFGGRLTYHIPTEKLRWSRVFSYIERNRSPWKLADYSLTQPSLEDVLLDIAKKKAIEKNQQTDQTNNQQKIQSRPVQRRATRNESPKADKDKGRSPRENKD